MLTDFVISCLSLPWKYRLTLKTHYNKLKSRANIWCKFDIHLSLRRLFNCQFKKLGIVLKKLYWTTLRALFGALVAPCRGMVWRALFGDFDTTFASLLFFTLVHWHFQLIRRIKKLFSFLICIVFAHLTFFLRIFSVILYRIVIVFRLVITDCSSLVYFLPPCVLVPCYVIVFVMFCHLLYCELIQGNFILLITCTATDEGHWRKRFFHFFFFFFFYFSRFFLSYVYIFLHN